MHIDEKDVPTKQYKSETHTRVPRSYENSRGTRSYQTASHKGTQAPQCADTTKAGSTLASTPARSTFPKAARLLVRREFLAIQRRGERRHSRHFVVITSPARTDRPRLGITASRRFGNAVMRNRIKRKLREFFRVRRAQISASYDILIIPKSRAKELSFPQVVTELERVLPIAQRAE